MKEMGERPQARQSGFCHQKGGASDTMLYFRPGHCPFDPDKAARKGRSSEKASLCHAHAG
jgi:hypothetical protein